MKNHLTSLPILFSVLFDSLSRWYRSRRLIYNVSLSPVLNARMRFCALNFDNLSLPVTFAHLRRQCEIPCLRKPERPHLYLLFIKYISIPRLDTTTSYPLISLRQTCRKSHLTSLMMTYYASIQNTVWRNAYCRAYSACCNIVTHDSSGHLSTPSFQHFKKNYYARVEPSHRLPFLPPNIGPPIFYE